MFLHTEGLSSVLEMAKTLFFFCNHISVRFTFIFLVQNTARRGTEDRVYPHSVVKMVLTLLNYDVVAPSPAITGNGYFVVMGMNQKWEPCHLFL